MGRYYDEKVKKDDRLGRDVWLGLLEDLLVSFSRLGSPRQAAAFLVGLLTGAEAKMIAKRLGVAKLLFDGQTYEEVTRRLKVSYGTVAKVGSWLKVGGDEVKRVVSRLPQKRSSSLAKELAKLPYFWPGWLLAGVGRLAERRSKRELGGFWSKFSARASHDREFKEEYTEGLRNRSKRS